MKVLMSIKPEFVDRIISGEKSYEFRRVLYKRNDISRIVVYASSPVCRIVGEIEVASLITDTPENLWQKTKDKAGISEQFFFSYFSGRDKAHAIEVKAFHPYEEHINLKDKYPSLVPPQSFCYIEEVNDYEAIHLVI